MELCYSKRCRIYGKWTCFHGHLHSMVSPKSQGEHVHWFIVLMLCEKQSVNTWFLNRLYYRSKQQIKMFYCVMAFNWCKSILTALSIHLSHLFHSESCCQGNSSQSFTCESKLLIVYRGCISVTEKGTKFISGRWASSRWLTCSLDPRILTVMKDDVSYKIKNFLVLPAPIQGPKDQCEIPDWIHCGIIRSP